MRLAGALLLLAAAAHARDTTFSIDYVVTIAATDPSQAAVRWELAGIEEIAEFRLVFRDDRTRAVHGSGRLDWQGRTLRWTPGGPYAHLAYVVAIDRRRAPGGARFDSHAGDGWIATRALHVFPEINVTFRPGAEDARSRARLVFHLPDRWDSVTALAPAGPHVYALEEPDKQLDRPRGWWLLGRVGRETRTIAGTAFTIATAPGSRLDVAEAFRRYARLLPLLARILGTPPPRLLLVSAPDPMWRGGISGEDSFFVNGRTPLRSSDQTSTYIHELIHSWQPFRPKDDGRWVAEAIAEYYALVLQHRAGFVSDAGLARGLASFVAQGTWGIDLSHTRDPRALNNSGPAVLALLDGEIARASRGRRTLDDAIRALAREGGALTTASFLRATTRAAGRDLTPLFRRHVLRGEPPPRDRVPRARLAGVAGVG